MLYACVCLAVCACSAVVCARDREDIDADLQAAESQLRHAEIARDDLVKRHSKIKVSEHPNERSGPVHSPNATLFVQLELATQVTKLVSLAQTGSLPFHSLAQNQADGLCTWKARRLPVFMCVLFSNRTSVCGCLSSWRR